MCPSTDWPGGSCWREVSRRPGSPVRISPQTLGNRENADQCASPNTRQKNFRRRPQGAPVSSRDLTWKGRAALGKRDAAELEQFLWSGVACTARPGRVRTRARYTQGPRRLGSLRAPYHLGKSEEPDGGPPGPATLTHLRGWDGPAGGQS